MRKITALISILLVCLSGCSDVEATYQPAYYDEDAIQSEKPKAESEFTSSSSASSYTIPKSDAGYSPRTVPEVTFSTRSENGELTFTIDGVYSGGSYYTVNISGSRCGDQSETSTDKTTYVNGELYGDFRIKTDLGGELTSLLKIDIPRDDKFLIMNSVTENLTYGCEVISNYREFGVTEYPDIIELDFFINNELIAPQYARFFAIFNGELIELPVYENGAPASPYGTHLEMRSAGFMVQYLTISTGGFEEYEVAKYEYTFDYQNRRLIKKRVRFYGWD